MKEKLKEVIKKNNDTMEDLANYLDIAYQTFSKKMNGHVDFNRVEIKKIRARYNMTPEEVVDVFDL